eukprot:TRINITY_DN1959_c0_g1_i1.p1 TRINITY_DN1959_c0_g1~~TRINITY_DN1959_c0_g1_i1.p1  ORF type:complete len:1028 (-),score=246.32 TRINITY_DN1959_c0_g1_i1:51-3134(-)
MRSGLKKLSSFRTLKEIKEKALSKNKRDDGEEEEEEGQCTPTASTSFPGINLRTSLPGGSRSDSVEDASLPSSLPSSGFSSSMGELPSTTSAKNQSPLPSGGSQSPGNSPSPSHHSSFRPFRASLRLLSPFKPEAEAQQPASSPFPGISLHVVAQKTATPPTSEIINSSSTESSSDSEEEDVPEASVAFPGINFHIVESKDNSATPPATVAPAEEDPKDRRKSRSNLFGVDTWKKYRKETLSSAFGKKNINFAADSKENSEESKKSSKKERKKEKDKDKEKEKEKEDEGNSDEEPKRIVITPRTKEDKDMINPDSSRGTKKMSDVIASIEPSNDSDNYSPKPSRKSQRERSNTEKGSSGSYEAGSEDGEDKKSRKGRLQKSHSFGRDSFRTMKKTLKKPSKLSSPGGSHIVHSNNSSPLPSPVPTERSNSDPKVQDAEPMSDTMSNEEEIETVIMSPRVDLIEEDEKEGEAMKELQKLLLPTTLEEIPAVVRARNQVINEFVMTEQEFVKDMVSFAKATRDPIKEGQLLSDQETKTLFSNLTVLVGISKELLKDLRAQLSETPPMIGKTFLQHVEFLKVYSSYCSNQSKAYALLEGLCTEMQPSSGSSIVTGTERTAISFRYWLHTKFGSPAAGQFAFRTYLIKPVQRVCKYPLLLRELLKSTPEDHPDRPCIEQALTKTEVVVTSINEYSRFQENIQKIVDVQGMFVGGEKLGLLTSSRRYVREAVFGELARLPSGSNTLSLLASITEKANPSLPVSSVPSNPAPAQSANYTNNCKDMMYFLFNDLLLRAAPIKSAKWWSDKGAKEPTGPHLKFKDSFPLNTLLVRDLPESLGFQIISSESQHILVANTMDEKAIWLKDLKSLIAQQIQLEIKRANETKSTGKSSPPRSPDRRHSNASSPPPSSPPPSSPPSSTILFDRDKEDRKPSKHHKAKSIAIPTLPSIVDHDSLNDITTNAPGLSIIATMLASPPISPRSVVSPRSSSQSGPSEPEQTTKSLKERIAKQGINTNPTLKPQSFVVTSDERGL